MLQSKKSFITLYSSTENIFCDQIKIILAEKDIKADNINVEKGYKKEELCWLNPYGKVPTLMTKDLIVYEPSIIIEYLEERFPYPPLLPIFPLEKANIRILFKKIEKEWIPILAETISCKNNFNTSKIINLLLELNAMLKNNIYITSNTYNVIDCLVSAILYKIIKLNIKITINNYKTLVEYAKKIFNRKAFKKCFKL